jgi:hypothetical protein
MSMLGSGRIDWKYIKTDVEDMWFDGRGNNEETGHRTDCGIL